MDSSNVRGIDEGDGQYGAPLESSGDAEEYRQQGVDMVKVSLKTALVQLEVANDYSEASVVPEDLRQRIKDLFLECRRASGEAEEVL